MCCCCHHQLRSSQGQGLSSISHHFICMFLKCPLRSLKNLLHLFVQNILGLKEIPQQFFLQVYYIFHKIPEARWAQWTADSCSVKSSGLGAYLNHLCSQSRRCDSGSVLSVLPGHADADEEFSGFAWRRGSSPRPVCPQAGVEFSY